MLRFRFEIVLSSTVSLVRITAYVSTSFVADVSWSFVMGACAAAWSSLELTINVALASYCGVIANVLTRYPATASKR